MAAVSCSLYFFANDGISPFIPLWITRAICAPLVNAGQSEHLLKLGGFDDHWERLGAEPGVGNGKAVPLAVWKVMLPSTFCMT
jgi:hypothetical protein